MQSNKVIISFPKKEIEKIKESHQTIFGDVSYFAKLYNLHPSQSRGESVLHAAIRQGIPVSVIYQLIKIGGKGLVLQKTKGPQSWTTLRYAIAFDSSIRVIKKLLQVGGRKLLFEDMICRPKTCLITDAYLRQQYNVANKIIEFGGNKFVREKNPFHDDQTCLHQICALGNLGFNNVDVVSKIIEYGGVEIVMQRDARGRVSLHHSLLTETIFDIDEMVDMLLSIGGREILLAHDDLNHSVISCVLSRNNNNWINLEEEHFEGKRLEKRINRLFSLMTQGVEFHIGGQFGLGGLFRTNDERGENHEITEVAVSKLQNQLVFDPYNWSYIVLPTLKRFNELHEQTSLILHTMILNAAPDYVVEDVIKSFDFCLITRDSRYRTVLHLSIDTKVEWNVHLRTILKHTATKLQTSMWRLALIHGLEWENGMSRLTEQHTSKVSKTDLMSNLYPFMLSASGERYDLSTIFKLIRLKPELVHVHDTSSWYNRRGRKRKLRSDY